MREVALFVAEKLATIEGVQNTATHFVLRRYKIDGDVLEQPEQAERLPIYQLWPALVHVRLFGSGYHGMAERMLRSCGA